MQREGLPNERLLKILSRKLANEASSEELSELDSLLLLNPGLQWQAEMLMQMWNQFPETPHSGVESAYMRHLMKYKVDFFQQQTGEVHDNPAGKEKTNSLVRKYFNYKAGISILAGLVLFIVSWFVFPGKKLNDNVKKEEISSIITKNGNRSKIALPDGSQVWLNAGSKLDYHNRNFNKELREVHLVGEAYFEVAKNPEKPFLVYTDNLKIKVLGTAFDVKSYPGEEHSEASLIHGSVEITIPGRPQEKYILNPNEKLVVNNTGNANHNNNGKPQPEKIKVKDTEAIVSIKKVNYLPEKNITLETAWVENRLEFRSERFMDVAGKMERWYDVNINFSSEKIGNIILTGSFENETIGQALEALKLAVTFNYIIQGNNIIILP